MACTRSFVLQAVSQWSGVPVTQLTEDTGLDGLGNKSWPQDAPDLINVINTECGCTIPPSVYETFARISDIDDFLEDEGLLEEE